MPLPIQRVLAVTALLFIASDLPADSARHEFSLTVDNIMRGPNLYGYRPDQVRWSGAGGRIYFRWKTSDEPVEKEASLWVVQRDGSGLRRPTSGPDPPDSRTD